MARINDYGKMWPARNSPEGRPLCRYCDMELQKPRRSWCSDKCRDMALIELNPHGYRGIVIKYLGYKCFVCEVSLLQREKYGEVPWNAKVEIHHIVHVKNGGDNKIENLVGLCHDCHVHVHKLCRMVDKILNESQGELML